MLVKEVSVHALPSNQELAPVVKVAREPLGSKASLAGMVSWFSSQYICQQNWSWRLLLRQPIWCALDLALVRAGSNRAARMAMIAMTTSNSMSVKPRGALVAGCIQGLRLIEAFYPRSTS